MSLVRASDVVTESADMHPPPSEHSPASLLSPSSTAAGSPAFAEITYAPHARGGTLSALSVVLTVGLVLGALLGAVLGAVQGRQPSATALLQLTPPSSPALTALGGGPPSSDTAENYVAGELAYLSSSTVRETLAERLGLGSPPDFIAAQESTSSVVRLTAEAGSEAAAVRIVQSAVDLYVQHRAEQAEQRTTAALASVDAALGPLTADPDALDDPRVQGLVDRLQNLRLDVLVQSGQDAAVEVVQPPAADPESGTPLWVLGIALGACVGGLVAVGAFRLRRTWSRRLMDPADLTGIAAKVLHPQVRLDRDWVQAPAGTDQPRYQHLARLLVAQVIGQEPTAGRTIVVAGASGASGSAAVASLIAVGAAEHGPTVLVRVGGRDSPHPLLTGPVVLGRTVYHRLWRQHVARNGHPVAPGGGTVTAAMAAADITESCVVVDAGLVTGSPAALESLRQASDVVLVVRLGVDELSDAAAVTATAGGYPGRVAAVVTNSAWWSRLAASRD